MRKNIISRGVFIAACIFGLMENLTAQSWTNTLLTAEQRAGALLAAMTQDEKIALLHGASGAYAGNIPSNARLGLPALNLQDGPAGVADGVGNVTAFPSVLTIAASWDTALARSFGSMLGQEQRGKGTHVMLGPMMNIARAPQAGRNFEGYGEDPQLSALMAAAEIQGIQSQGVIATAKHFVCNDQETDRTLVSSDVDERTRQEIYYPPFRASVRAGVGAVMSSYNRVNGRYAGDSEALNAVLKKLWGFDGFVMTDWGAGFSTVAGANNGLDVEMYCSGQFASSGLTPAINSGNVPLSDLDGMAHRVLATMFRFGVFDSPPAGNLNSVVTSSAHNQFAREAAAQGHVLLKNNGLLPLNLAALHSIAVIGSAASAVPISTGYGSGGVNLPYQITPLAGITNRAGRGVTCRYSQGDQGHITEAVQAAKSSDIAIVCVGQLTGEGTDRTSLSLPNDQDALISAVAAANPNTIVVLYASGATLMPWDSQVAATVVAWFPGQENGNALASILFGDVNPSGKLPITLPATASQMPVSTLSQFPGIKGHVSYSEGLLVGYRWYDANNVAPLYCFGHGLSYTTFGYSNLTVSAVSPAGQVRVGLNLSNTGLRAGAEVVQLYLGFPSGADEPPKQLKTFKKLFLQPGETQQVTFTLNAEDLSCWDAGARGWVIPPGTFQVMIGSSSRDIRLTGALTASSGVLVCDLANLALHKAVTVSSVLNSSTPGGAAVDGNPASSWSSLASDPQWIMADLGDVKTLRRVRLQWGANYASSYRIEASTNAADWNILSATTSGLGGIEDLAVSGAARYLRVYGLASATSAGYSLSELEVYSPAQRPFGGTVHSLPGRIEAENYDTGGEGVAYHDSDPENQGGTYRTDAVDIQPTTDVGKGYDIGWSAPGEWLEYTVNVPDASATYSFGLRVASTSGGQMRLRMDGRVLGTMDIPNTGGWQNWQTIAMPAVPIQGAAASQALRLEVLGGSFNINWIEATRTQPADTNNIALNRPSASLSDESGNYPASNALDGDPRTRWSSEFSDPQWIRVDLGSNFSLARVKLNWEVASAQSFSIQLSSDGQAWTNAYSTTNGIGGVNDLAIAGNGRYVRLYSTQRSTSYGDSLWDFEVYPSLVPALSITRSDPNVIITWPVTTTKWQLETTRLLGGIPSWVVLDSTVINSQNVFTSSLLPSSQYYRLKQVQ